ncbi:MULTISPECIES: hypothetical protein [unclassified Acinetobacter]|uniref:hypothetical protein n=1 Tax=unclassified Acinetobacter TaxID=196816 RepID=UPI0015D2ECCD|nr:MULTISPECIES: hypothetical protein [unclassified Acinetobacter]
MTKDFFYTIQAKDKRQKTKDKRQKTKDKRQKTKDKRQLYQSDKSQAQKNRNMCGNLFKLVRSERFELPTP